jgi:hypothetical protein
VLNERKRQLGFGVCQVADLLQSKQILGNFKDYSDTIQLKQQKCILGLVTKAFRILKSHRKPLNSPQNMNWAKKDTQKKKGNQ